MKVCRAAACWLFVVTYWSASAAPFRPYHIGLNLGWVPSIEPAVIAGWAFDAGADMPRVGARLDLAQRWGVGHPDATVTRFTSAGRHPLLFLFNENVQHLRPDGSTDEGCKVPEGLWEAVFTRGGDAGGPDAEVNPGNPWARFVWEIVERYDSDGQADAPGSPKIQYFSLWNEPDWLPWPTRPSDPRDKFLRGWYGHDMTDLARLIFVSWLAAKRANPACKIGIQLCFSETLGFLLDDPRYPAANYIDFVDFHAYAGPGSDTLIEAEGGLEGVYKSMALEFDKRGLQRPEFLCTECGYPGDEGLGPAYSEAVQRAAAVKVQIAGAALGLVTVCWYGLFDPCWQNMGLVGDVSGLPRDGQGARFKQAFHATRTLATLMGPKMAEGTMGYAGRVECGGTGRGHEFRTADGKRVFVLWAHDPDGNPNRRVVLSLGLPQGRYARYEWDYSLTGKPAALITSDGEPQEISVGIDPIYLTEYREGP
ncbi:MAG: hypothetical protein N2512_12520 [Armatimonadetes bacterium]|nr:hypothetical protein [Armatimonadota bacterium]